MVESEFVLRWQDTKGVECCATTWIKNGYIIAALLQMRHEGRWYAVRRWWARYGMEA